MADLDSRDDGTGLRRDGVADSEPSRLTKEEVDKLVERLYYRQMQIAAQKEADRQAILQRSLVHIKQISSEEEDQLVHRIYEDQLVRIQMTKTARDQKAAAEAKQNDLKKSPSEIDEQVERMYTEELSKSKSKREELARKYGYKPDVKIIPAAQVKEAAERLSHVDWEAREDKLMQKHVYPYDPKVKTISKAEVDAMASRLCTVRK